MAKTGHEKPILLFALGGNALIRKGQCGTIREQFDNLRLPVRQIATNYCKIRTCICQAIPVTVNNQNKAIEQSK